MTNWTTLPHEKLIAYQVARDLLVAVREACISEGGFAIRPCALPPAHA